MKMMRILYPLALCALLFAGACSYLFPPRAVECCENKAACCFDQMCCLPRYAKAAGVEPKPFTTNIPVYNAARQQDLEPPPGAVIVKKGWLAQWNPFGGADERPQVQTQQPSQQNATASASAEQKEEPGFWSRWNPFPGPAESSPRDNASSTGAGGDSKEEKGFWSRWLPF
jgi:hypothetical protein